MARLPLTRGRRKRKLVTEDSDTESGNLSRLTVDPAVPLLPIESDSHVPKRSKRGNDATPTTEPLRSTNGNASWVLMGSRRLGDEAPIATPQPVDESDPYAVRDVLNRGGFGIVAVVELKNDRTKKYARKQLHLDASTREVVRKEVDLIRKARHRHVVRVVDEYTSANEERYYIVMEPAADCDLGQYLARIHGQPRSDPEWKTFGEQRSMLLRWMRCLAGALQHIHSQGIRHRDIKPGNILVHGENILFTDFGTSFHSEQDTRYSLTSTYGSAKYLPPEAENDRRFGRSGDMFSLGCVFWEMSAGLSHPILSVKFPHISEHGYSSYVTNQDLGAAIGTIRENPALKRRLPEMFRFSPNFLHSLLLLTSSMLRANPAERVTSEELIDSVSAVLAGAPASALPCCASLHQENESCSSDAPLSLSESRAKHDPGVFLTLLGAAVVGFAVLHSGMLLLADVSIVILSAMGVYGAKEI